MKNLVNVAVEYANRGYSVVPIGLNKMPLIKFADKPSMTENEIRDFWAKNPYALIGLRTTSFFVIDADVNHTEGVNGVDNLKKFIEEHPRIFKNKQGEWITENTLAQKTAGGGLQIFFKKPLSKDKNGNAIEGNYIPLKQNIGWLSGVDVKAHPNNYVVVAPSERPNKDEDGNYIKDENGDFVTTPYEWKSETRHMLEAPISLVRSIDRNSMAKLNNKGKSLGVNFIKNRREIDSNKIKKLFKALDLIANGFGDEGARNDTLARFVGDLLYIGVDPETVRTLSHIANENTPNPLSNDETEKTYWSILMSDLKKEEA